MVSNSRTESTESEREWGGVEEGNGTENDPDVFTVWTSLPKLICLSILLACIIKKKKEI